MIEVYHWTLNEPEQRKAHGFLLNVPQAQLVMQGRDPDLFYKKVALVDTDALDHAFELTNNIDYSWTKNPGVVTEEVVCRSTSTGDVLRRMSDDTYFLVASIGFKILDM